MVKKKMKLYKLTDENYETQNDTKWEIGKTNSLPRCEKPELSENVFHAYKNLNLGLLLNPIHARFKKLKILLCEGEINAEDWDEVGAFELTPIEEVEIPGWYQNRETRKKVLTQFAILCAEKVLHVFEERLPEDIRPRNAIKAAKKYLKNPTDENAEAAIIAANAAADAARIDKGVIHAAAHAADSAACLAVCNDGSESSALVAAYAAKYIASIEDKVIIDCNEIADRAVQMVKESM